MDAMRVCIHEAGHKFMAEYYGRETEVNLTKGGTAGNCTYYGDCLPVEQGARFILAGFAAESAALGESFDYARLQESVPYPTGDGYNLLRLCERAWGQRPDWSALTLSQFFNANLGITREIITANIGKIQDTAMDLMADHVQEAAGLRGKATPAASQGSKAMLGDNLRQQWAAWRRTADRWSAGEEMDEADADAVAAFMASHERTSIFGGMDFGDFATFWHGKKFTTVKDDLAHWDAKDRTAEREELLLSAGLVR